MLRTALMIAAAVTLVLAPAAASAKTARVGAGFVVRMDAAAAQSASGRAALIADIDRAATRLCRGVSPRIDRVACEDQARDSAFASASPAGQEAISLARRESGTRYASLAR